MRTGNPAFNNAAFASADYDYSESRSRAGTYGMTINGAIAKTGFLVAIMLAAAGLAWSMVFPQGTGVGAVVNKPMAFGFMIGGLVVGLITGIVLMFSQRSAPIAAPIYAAAEGLFLGAISGVFNMKYQGLVLQAGMLTTGVLIMMLVAYGSGLVRATEKFKMGVIAATFAIGMVYLATMLLRLFGVEIPYIHGAGPIGIGFSIVVVIIAALNLVLDFDMIEQGARSGLPKYMEWYSGYALLVTLVWLYIEILRLLAKLRNSE
jgi:uncharacterized YccA/Bax inhibitor family protein